MDKRTGHAVAFSEAEVKLTSERRDSYSKQGSTGLHGAYIQPFPTGLNLGGRPATSNGTMNTSSMAASPSGCSQESDHCLIFKFMYSF